MKKLYDDRSNEETNELDAGLLRESGAEKNACVDKEPPVEIFSNNLSSHSMQEINAALSLIDSERKKEKILLRKKGHGANNDYLNYKKMTTEIVTLLTDIDELATTAGRMIEEKPSEEIGVLVDSIKTDLKVIEPEITKFSTTFDHIKTKGTKNLKQRIKVLEMSEKVEDLHAKILNNVIPTVLDLTEKVTAHTEEGGKND